MHYLSKCAHYLPQDTKTVQTICADYHPQAIATNMETMQRKKCREKYTCSLEQGSHRAAACGPELISIADEAEAELASD